MFSKLLNMDPSPAMSTLRSPDVIHVTGVPSPSLYYTECKPKNKYEGGRTFRHTHTQLNPVYLASMLGITHMIKCARSLFFLSGRDWEWGFFLKVSIFWQLSSHTFVVPVFLVVSNFHQCTKALKINKNFLKRKISRSVVHNINKLIHRPEEVMDIHIC